MKWNDFLFFIEKEFGVLVDWESKTYTCPECGTTVKEYDCLDPAECPVCGYVII